MGLEMVEVVMELEDEFRISIRDEDLADVRTVGDLHDLIVAKLGLRELDSVCITSHIFYALRRALTEVTGLPRDRITPATEVDELLPARQRPRLWRLWRSRSGIRLPRLLLPEPLETVVQVVIAVVTAGVAVTSLYAWHHVTGSWTGASTWMVVIGWIPAAAAYAAMRGLVSRWAHVLPRQLQTLGDVVRDLVQHHDARGRQPRVSHDTVTRDTVWSRLVGTLARQPNVKRDAITRSTDLAKDLRI